MNAVDGMVSKHEFAYNPPDSARFVPEYHGRKPARFPLPTTHFFSTR